MEGGLESEGQKWVVAGISFGVPLKPVFTSTPAAKRKEDEGEEEYCSTTTPTGDEARISTSTECPPPPRKRKPSSRCHYGGAGEFFNPPDLETVFTLRVERA
ncbi:hypothetical protein C3L33_13451, partial [Rhododendron williamsianum]